MRKTDSAGLGYPGREKPPGLRDAEPNSYVFEEVTPERMRRVDLLARAGSDSGGGELPDNGGRVHGYRCGACSSVTSVLARDPGHVPLFVRCARPGCAGDAVQQDGESYAELPDAEQHAGSGGEVHAVFFRPLTDGEIATWAAGVEAEARVVTGELGGDPEDGEDQLRQALQDAEATHLINGNLEISYGPPAPS